MEMMQKYSFFDAVEGLPEYTAQDVADRTAELAGAQNGYLVGNRESLLVTISDTNATLHTGAALIQGRLYVNDTVISFAVPLCSTEKIRQDRVVIRLDNAVESRSITAYLKQGVEGVSGISPPDLTQAGTVYELSVARIDVTDVAVTVSDERGTSTCPALHTGEAAAQASLGHSARADNPHGVTKAQVGLGSVENLSFADYVAKAEIINDLVTGGIDKVLSAEQGKTIKTILDGLDTKYLIDSGSNANGSYTKLPDGTLICRGTKTYTNVAFLPIGNVFYADLGFMVFPITFISAPDVAASIDFGNIGAVGSGWVDTTQFANSVISADSTTRSVTIRYIAIGRWRA